MYPKAPFWVQYASFINDLDDVVDLVEGFVFKFADDTKYGRSIIDDTDREKMQRDIDKLLQWAETWQMAFNAKKCKVMHFGRSNPGFTYTMGGYAPAGTILEAIEEEKDIGVMIHQSLKPSSQCFKAASKASQVLGQMRRSFQYRDKYVWIHLYKTYVRHHLEVSCQAWSPWLKRDIEILERVQRRAVNLVVGLKGESYEEKLREVGLLSLYDRRRRGDVIQVWKALNGLSIINSEMFQHVDTINSRVTRCTSKPLNLVKPVGKKEIRTSFFSLRVINEWNNLPAKSSGCLP